MLETTVHGPTGEVRLLDCFVMGDVERSHPDRRLLRVIEGKRGAVELEIRVAPRFDYGEVRPWLRRHGHRLRSASGGNDALIVWCEAELEEDREHELVARATVGVGDRIHLHLAYCPPELVAVDQMHTARNVLPEVEHVVRGWRGAAFAGPCRRSRPGRGGRRGQCRRACGRWRRFC